MFKVEKALALFLFMILLVIVTSCNSDDSDNSIMDGDDSENHNEFDNADGDLDNEQLDCSEYLCEVELDCYGQTVCYWSQESGQYYTAKATEGACPCTCEYEMIEKCENGCNESTASCNDVSDGDLDGEGCDLNCEEALICPDENICSDVNMLWYPAVIKLSYPECSCSCDIALVEECENGCNESTASCIAASDGDAEFSEVDAEEDEEDVEGGKEDGDLDNEQLDCSEYLCEEEIDCYGQTVCYWSQESGKYYTAKATEGVCPCTCEYEMIEKCDYGCSENMESASCNAAPAE